VCKPHKRAKCSYKANRGGKNIEERDSGSGSPYPKKVHVLNVAVKGQAGLWFYGFALRELLLFVCHRWYVWIYYITPGE
jgi:hypothetical protein